MTTYAFPTLSRSAPPEVIFGLRANTQVFTSPLSGGVQTLELPGARWTQSFTWPQLDEADASDLQAWCMQMRGQANRAALKVYHRPVPRGSIALAGVTLSASVAQFAAGATLAGCGAGATLQAGDYFAVGTELKMAVADATANGAGVMSVTFEPPVRASTGWSAGAAVVTNAPTAVYVLTDPHVKWTTGRGVRTSIALDFVEVFA